MARFRYKTVDAEGKAHNGEATAKTPDSIIAELRNRGLTLLEINEVVEKAAPVQAAAQKVVFNFGLSLKATSLFTRQLATTLTAGVPLLRIIAVLRKRNSNPVMCQLLDQLNSDLQKGLRFSEALGRHPRIFDETYLNMTKVGEASGNLPETMTRLSTMLEKEVAIRRKISSAMTYPSFILIFTMLLCYGLIAFLMPLFLPMLEASGLDIKTQYPLTQFLMDASKFVTNTNNIILCVVGAVVFFFGFRLFARSKTGSYILDIIKWNIPFLRTLLKMSATARFSRSFALLLQSGVPLLQALQLVGNAAGNQVVQRALERVAKDITEGGRLSEKLDKVGLFPDLMIQMTSIGEEAGSLPEMFEHVADYYEMEIDSAVTSLTSILEPAMMIIVGGIVGMFIMGVLLPIMGISAAVQKGM